MEADLWKVGVRLDYKPLSANRMYTMKKKKSWDYTKYERAWAKELEFVSIPEEINTKDTKYMLTVIAGFSSRASDLDNCLKPLQDILQRELEFNDKQVYDIIASKYIVPKGQEFIEIELRQINREETL